MATANWLPLADRETPATLNRSWRLRHTGAADEIHTIPAAPKNERRYSGGCSLIHLACRPASSRDLDRSRLSVEDEPAKRRDECLAPPASAASIRRRSSSTAHHPVCSTHSRRPRWPQGGEGRAPHPSWSHVRSAGFSRPLPNRTSGQSVKRRAIVSPGLRTLRDRCAGPSRFEKRLMLTHPPKMSSLMIYVGHFVRWWRNCIWLSGGPDDRDGRY
jgi:hypothetical protein